MKKIVALGAIAALAGGMIFADEPAIDIKVAEFNGNATVKWGIDLDAGQHGFTNDDGNDLNLKVNLWNEASKATEGDGIWGEVKITGKGLAIKNKAFDGDGNVALDTAKIHFGDKVYLGIKSGDTQVGEYKFDGAIRSADNDNAKWLTNVGPAGFSQGVVLGYGDDNFGVDVDFRSYKSANTNYTSAYGIAAEAQLKDSNEFVSGLKVDAGVAYNLSSTYNDKGANDKLAEDVEFTFDVPADIKAVLEFDPTPATPAADPLKAEKDAVEAAKKAFEENPSTTTLTALEDAEKDLKIASQAAANAAAAAPAPAATEEPDPTKINTLGYGVNVGYKFKIDDKYYVKPAVGFTGSLTTATTKDTKSTLNSNNLVVGALFGWGDTADANAGVYFLDGDGAKKVTPGVSVVAAIPLATVGKVTEDGETATVTANSKVKAIIVPSVYLGDLVPNLKFAAYSEMALLNWVDDPSATELAKFEKIILGDNVVTLGDKKADVFARAANKDRTFALAVATGVSYDIKSDELTITPKAGIRYANAAYVENKINSIAPLSNNKVFDELGIAGKDEKGNNDFFNLKAGLDVNGLIDNTTLFAEYASANLLNDNEYKNAKGDTEKYYNIKNGTFNVGCKIHF